MTEEPRVECKKERDTDNATFRDPPRLRRKPERFNDFVCCVCVGEEDGQFNMSTKDDTNIGGTASVHQPDMETLIAAGMAIVVAGDGLNMPRIQVDTRPDSGRHATVPTFFTAFHDSNATTRTAGAGAIPSAIRMSGWASRRTVRLTSISNGVSE